MSLWLIIIILLKSDGERRRRLTFGKDNRRHAPIIYLGVNSEMRSRKHFTHELLHYNSSVEHVTIRLFCWFIQKQRTGRTSCVTVPFRLLARFSIALKTFWLLKTSIVFTLRVFADFVALSRVCSGSSSTSFWESECFSEVLTKTLKIEMRCLSVLS